MVARYRHGYRPRLAIDRSMLCIGPNRRRPKLRRRILRNTRDPWRYRVAVRRRVTHPTPGVRFVRGRLFGAQAAIAEVGVDLCPVGIRKAGKLRQAAGDGPAVAVQFGVGSGCALGRGFVGCSSVRTNGTSCVIRVAATGGTGTDRDQPTSSTPTFAQPRAIRSRLANWGTVPCSGTSGDVTRAQVSR